MCIIYFHTYTVHAHLLVLISYLIAQSTAMDRLKLKTSLASFSDSSQLSSFTERLAQSFKTCLLTVQYLCFVWRRRTWFILLYNVDQKQVYSVYYTVQVPAIIHNTCKEKNNYSIPTFGPPGIIKNWWSHTSIHTSQHAAYRREDFIFNYAEIAYFISFSCCAFQFTNLMLMSHSL